MVRCIALVLAFFAATAMHVQAQPVSVAPTWPAPVDGNYTVPEFHFADGEMLSHLRLHYITLGKAASVTRGSRR